MESCPHKTSLYCQFKTTNEKGKNCQNLSILNSVLEVGTSQIICPTLEKTEKTPLGYMVGSLSELIKFVPR